MMLSDRDSVEKEFSEIEADWHLDYLDLEPPDSDRLRYVVEVAKEEVTLKVRVPENYPEEIPRFEFCGALTMGIDQEMRQKILRTTYQNMAPGTGKPLIKSALEVIWKQLKPATVEKGMESVDFCKEKPVLLARKRGKKKTRYIMAAQFGVVPNLSPRHEVLQTQNSLNKGSDVSDSLQKTKKGKKQKNKMPLDKKASPMKTARDVINRLKWDDQLKSQEFTVGYLDRFKGTIEIPVFDLNWEDDIAATGPNDKLAIPEHRIEYFKWNSVIVWEKITRTDHVFASTGSKTDIVEFVKRWKLKEQEAGKGADSGVGSFSSTTIVTGIKADEEQGTTRKGEFGEQEPKQQDSTTEIMHVKEDGLVDEVPAADIIGPSMGNDGCLSKSSFATEKDPSHLSESSKSVPDDAAHVVQDRNENLLEPGDTLAGPDKVTELMEEILLKVERIDIPRSDGNDGATSMARDEKFFEDRGIIKGDGPVSGDQVLPEVASATVDADKVAEPANVDNVNVSSSNGNVVEGEDRFQGSSIEEAFQGIFSSDWAEADGNRDDKDSKHPDMTSCPKNAPKQHRINQSHHPYSNQHSSNRKENDRWHKDRRDRRQRGDGRDREGGWSQSETYSGQRRTGSQYCLAVDLEASHTSDILHRFSRSFEHMWPEPYLFVNIGTCIIETRKNENVLRQKLSQICQNLEPFQATLGDVSIVGDWLRVLLDRRPFENLFRDLLTSLGKGQKHYDFIFDPHIQLATVREDRRFVREALHGNLISISSLYLWKLGVDDQCPQYVYLGQRRRGGQNSWHSRDGGGRSHLQKKISRNGKEVYNSEWETTVSKKLSAVLRHNAMGFEVDSNGFLGVKDLLSHQFFKKLGVEQEDIEYIVHNNAKKRFALEEHSGTSRIRANQGHTVQVENFQLKEITEPEKFPVVVHGTNMELLDAIVRTGLNRMRRNHIHMTTALPRGSEQVISGMRNSSNCFIYIDIRKAMKDGIKFFLSENGVILSEGKDGVLHPKYICHVCRRQGKQVIDLPLKRLDRSETPSNES